MSILIKGMEMPKNCGECVYFRIGKFCTLKNGYADNVESYVAEHIRHPLCPLVELPPHGRLGDLDRLEQMFVDIDNAPYSGFDGENPFYSAEDAAQIIRLAPTIIEAEEGKDG